MCDKEFFLLFNKEASPARRRSSTRALRFPSLSRSISLKSCLSMVTVRTVFRAFSLLETIINVISKIGLIRMTGSAMSEQQPLVLLMIEVKKTAALIKALADEILNVIQDTNEALMDLDRRVKALEEWALEETDPGPV